MVLSGVSFQGTWVDKFEGAGPGEGDPLDNSEETRVENKLGIFYDEVMVITLGVADRVKLGGDEISGTVYQVDLVRV